MNIGTCINGDHNTLLLVLQRKLELIDLKLIVSQKIKVARIQGLYKKNLVKLMIVMELTMHQHLRLQTFQCACKPRYGCLIETADIIFMNDKLENLPKMINLARELDELLYKYYFSTSVIALLMIF